MAARAVWLLLAVLLAVPPLAAARDVATTVAFLVEFLSDRRWRPLSAVSAAPAVRPLPAHAGRRPVPTDLHSSPGLASPPGLVLVHGLAPTGKDEPRLRDAAALMARAGWAVAVPTVDGLTRLRLRPEDAGAVTAAARALDRAGYSPVSILGVSVGAGPALLAAGDPRIAKTVAAALALGGYASTRELLRYTLTGAFRFGEMHGWRAPDEAAIELFVGANRELVEAGGRALVENRDPAAVDGLMAMLPAQTQRLLDDLSPASRMDRIRAPLFLIHGRADPAVPFTESLRLAAAARGRGLAVRLAIVGAVTHVEPGRQTPIGDLWQLWAAFYAFRVTSAGRDP